MSGAAGIDVRYPIGALFTVLGFILAGYGLATAADAAHYAPSLSVNVNLWWGLAMLAFGVVLLLLAWRSHQASADRPAEKTPEGRLTEQREHVLGLEKD
jgi:membrane protein implicated in regulation of membrane protease activity